MDLSYRLGGEGDDGLKVLWEDGDRVFCRGWCLGADGNRTAVLVTFPAAERPSPASLDRLDHEYGMKDELDSAWAARPLELVREAGRTIVCTENSVRIDLVAESLNVIDDGRVVKLLPDALRLAVQVEEPT